MNKPLTREEWLNYLETTWKKCLADAWQKEWDDMSREDIIRMAREAGAHDNGWEVRFVEPKYLEQFAALVAAAEREACAKVCEKFGYDNHHGVITDQIATAIRARGTNHG